LGSVQKDSRKHEGPFRKQGIGIVVSVPGRSSQLRPQAVFSGNFENMAERVGFEIQLIT
jgi:hypothetical protein